MSNIINGHNTTNPSHHSRECAFIRRAEKLSWESGGSFAWSLPPMARNYRMTANLSLTNQMMVFSKTEIIWDWR